MPLVQPRELKPTHDVIVVGSGAAVGARPVTQAESGAVRAVIWLRALLV